MVRRLDPLETGGVLLGYATSASEVVVGWLSGAIGRPKRGLFSFAPDTRAHQEVVDKYHGASDGILTYVGEWHSHPLAALAPSHLDVATMQDVARRLQPAALPPVLILVRRYLRLKIRAYAVSANVSAIADVIDVADDALPQDIQRFIRRVSTGVQTKPS